MRTHARGFWQTGLGWAALVVLGSGLSGCSLVAGWLAEGRDPAAPLSLDAATGDDDRRRLQLTLRPGVSLLQAAERAPRAVAMLRGAARRLGEASGDWSVLDGSYLNVVRSGLLSEGLLLPGPLGALELRTIAPEPVPSAAPAEQNTGAGAEAEAWAVCARTRALSELVSAYRAGSQLLLLRADGQFLLIDGVKRRTGAPAGRSGRFTLHCQTLVLTAEAAPPIRLAPLAHDGWMDDRGSAFFPLSEPTHGDVP